MPKLIMLVGPPGSGKSTWAKNQIANGGDLGAECAYINQDSQGKFQHRENFREALRLGKDIILDRMNFNKVQRSEYLEQARALGYEVDIHVFHVPYAECFKRASARLGHETIHDTETAEKAIRFFFKSYERVEDWEADKVVRHYMEGDKPFAIVCDLDGTLCNVEHRRHHVRTEGKKKNWMAFMDGIKDDTVNLWCEDLLNRFGQDYKIVYCSGRGHEQWQPTVDWLNKNDLLDFSNQFLDWENKASLYMRMSGDSRQDNVVKEIILDFEILTRYTPYFMIDDRTQVVSMWRKRGFTCLQCDEGNF
jgi:predicted kinase